MDFRLSTYFIVEKTWDLYNNYYTSLLLNYIFRVSCHKLCFIYGTLTVHDNNNNDKNERNSDVTTMTTSLLLEKGFCQNRIFLSLFVNHDGDGFEVERLILRYVSIL